MKSKSLLLLAGAGAPLILSSAASADFIGLKTVKKSFDGLEQFVALVVNLYATFDESGGALIGMAGLPGFEMNISTIDGNFYQNILNTSNAGRTAPPQAFADLFPSLTVDTFLTIGLKIVPTGHADTTNLTPTFPTEGGKGNDGFWSDTRLNVTDGAWFAFNPDSDQARPGFFDNPPNQVLVGQFSIAADGAGANPGVFGIVLVQGEQADGTVFQEYISFDQQVPAPGALALLGSVGLLGLGRRRRR